jgi:hypothetical protein
LASIGESTRLVKTGALAIYSRKWASFPIPGAMRGRSPWLEKPLIRLWLVPLPFVRDGTATVVSLLSECQYCHHPFGVAGCSEGSC